MKGKKKSLYSKLLSILYFLKTWFSLSRILLLKDGQTVYASKKSLKNFRCMNNMGIWYITGSIQDWKTSYTLNGSCPAPSGRIPLISVSGLCPPSARVYYTQVVQRGRLTTQECGKTWLHRYNNSQPPFRGSYLEHWWKPSGFCLCLRTTLCHRVPYPIGT